MLKASSKHALKKSSRRLENQQKFLLGYKYMTSISKNVYIDKLDDIVNKNNNTYYSTIKKKPVDVKSNIYIDSTKEINDNDLLNLKLMILLEYQNTKTFLQKAMFQIGLKKFLWLNKLKTLRRGHMLLVIFKANKLLERFTKIGEKATIVILTVVFIRKTQYQCENIFQNPDLQEEE